MVFFPLRHSIRRNVTVWKVVWILRSVGVQVQAMDGLAYQISLFDPNPAFLLRKVEVLLQWVRVRNVQLSSSSKSRAGSLAARLRLSNESHYWHTA